MEEQLISFKTAKLAKEKGFNELTDLIYLHHPNTYRGIKGTDSWKLAYDLVEFKYRNKYNGHSYNEDEQYSAPTQSLLQQWLREKYHLDVYVASNGLYCYFPMIQLLEIDGTQMKSPKVKIYKKWEDALETGLQEALKLIK